MADDIWGRVGRAGAALSGQLPQYMAGQAREQQAEALRDEQRRKQLLTLNRTALVDLASGRRGQAEATIQQALDMVPESSRQPVLGVLQRIQAGDEQGALEELKYLDDRAVQIGELDPIGGGTKIHSVKGGQAIIERGGNISATPIQGYDPELAGGSPNSVREYQFARQQGYEGSYSEFIKSKRGGVNVNLPGEPMISKPPPGYSVIADPANPSGYRYEQIPGGPVDKDAQSAADKARGRQEQQARAGTTVIQDLQRALDLVPSMAGGDGIIGATARRTAGGIPGTNEHLFNQFKESALSNVGLDTLQQMRENSPTGGALGQVPIQQQKRLEQVLGSLDISQPPKVLRDNINRVKNIYIDVVYGSRSERQRLVDEGRMTPEQHQEIQSYYKPLSFDALGNRQTDNREIPAATNTPPTSGGIRILRIREN